AGIRYSSSAPVAVERGRGAVSTHPSVLLPTFPAPLSAVGVQKKFVLLPPSLLTSACTTLRLPEAGVVASSKFTVYHMVDYSRFDHIGSDSDDDGAAGVGSSKPTAMGPDAPAQQEAIRAISSSSLPSGSTAAGGGGRNSSGSGGGPGEGGGGSRASVPQPKMMTASKKGKEGRIKFEHEGRTVYEWEQSLEEVNLYIETPPGVKADRIECKITPRHICLGLKGNPPFIDVR
ncbi:unnamed protein product, partial [Ectocarpus sp. 8 AP-2014]